MAEAIVKNKRRILPCAAYLEGEYGHEGIFLGVPCQLGEGGLQRIIEVELTDSEAEALANSARAVRETIGAL